jgi:hypothetical protein
MARKHGITANTYKKFAIDAGAVYKNYGTAGEALLGATRGGTTFTIEQEIREMEVDGAKGPVKGSERITRVRPVIVANFIELSTDILKLGLPGSSSADFPATQGKTHDQITRSLAIALADYVDNITIVGECTGSATGFIECGISNALANGNFEMSRSDNDESVLTLTFVGHFLASNLDSEPWFYRFPVIA